MPNTIRSPPRRTSHHSNHFAKHIPSTHSTISAWCPCQPLSLSTTSTLSYRGTTGSISRSTRLPIMGPSAPEVCTLHDGSRWKPRCPSHGRYYSPKRALWTGRAHHASEKRRKARSSVSRTPCASLSRSPTTTTAGSPHLPPISHLPSPSISYAFVPRHGPLLHIHIHSLEYSRLMLPLLLLPSPRRRRYRHPHRITTRCLNSLHTRNYSILMEM